MGVAGSASRHSKAATVAAKEKRKKTPKPQSRWASAGQDVAGSPLVKKRDRTQRQKPLGPGTRPGTHQDLPITIDSDEEAESVASLETSASAAVRAYSLPAAPLNRATSCPSGPTANDSHIPYTLGPGPYAFSTPAPRCERAETPKLFALPFHFARYSDQKLYEEILVSVEPSTPGNTRNNIGSLAEERPWRAQTTITNVFPQQLAGQSIPSIPTVQLQRSATQHAQLSSPTSSFADEGIELTLADIEDFRLRQKTAQLVAVAPGLPLADLYHILMDRKGHFKVAKEEVLRLSQERVTSPPAWTPFASGRAATVPLTAAINLEESKDDTYIKIDFDDPDFMFDDDAPTEPPSEPGRQRRYSQTKPKKVAAKVTKKPAKSALNVNPCSSGTRTKSPAKGPTWRKTPSPPAKSSKGHVVKSSQGKGVGDINRGMRETSYDRSFIVPDDEVPEDSDDTYSESDEVGIDMTDDGIDLTIDMEPEFAYNSDILLIPSSR